MIRQMSVALAPGVGLMAVRARGLGEVDRVNDAEDHATE